VPAPLVAVQHQAVEPGQHEQQQEDVEQGHPGQHELHPVQRHQQARRAAQHGRAEQPPGEPGDEQDRDGTGDGGRDAPAELGVAEELLADSDQPLA
jgi:hypothetical protein